MKNFFRVVIMLVLFPLFAFGCGGGGGNSGGGGATTEPEYWIEVENFIETSVDVSGETFQVSVKDWGGNVQGDVWIQAEFAEFFAGELDEDLRVQEICTNSNGQASFFIPRYDEEGEREVFVWLSDFPEVAKEKAIIAYTRHLQYIGPAFTGTGGIVGIKEDYFAETYSFSNIALIQGIDTWSVIDRVLAASDLGLQSIISVSHIFFDIQFDEDGYVSSIELWPDHLKYWLEFASEIQPCEDSVIGFLGLDEPYWNGMNCSISFQEMRQMIEEVAFQIKTRFPNKKVIGTIVITEREMAEEEIWGHLLPEDAWEWYGIPTSYDWIGIYYYWVGFSGDFNKFEKIWKERRQSFEKHLSPSQQIVLIPGTFYNGRYQDGEIEQDLIALAPWYLDMAKRDLRVVTVMQFLWPDHESGNLVGLESMPDLQDVWREIGEEIVFR